MIDQYILDSVFHHIPATDEKDEVYWRSCILRDGMTQGEQGYMLYWPGSNNHHHTYRYPPDWY